MNCRHCGSHLTLPLIDLGHSPPSNNYLTKEALSQPEVYLPLRVGVCEVCWLVQTEDFAQPESLFAADYAYFSSTSKTWLQHAENYCAKMTNLLRLDAESFVVELASNDGYLLKNFVRAGIPCLGIEPTAATADAARELGIDVIEEFFGCECARKLSVAYPKADLIVGNNVYAHVPDINDFTRGIAELLCDSGTVTLEFPHLLQLIDKCQFDTIYHEHYSYLSLLAVGRVFESAGLQIWDAEELPTHGGSLRVYGSHASQRKPKSARLIDLLEREMQSGLNSREGFCGFQEKANKIKNSFLDFLLRSRRQGKTIAAYGAAAKGNTLLNFAGVKPDLISMVVDAAAAKQGKFLPGTHIPIYEPEFLFKEPPDVVLILPWNLSGEIRGYLKPLEDHGVEIYSLHPDLVSFH